MPHDLDAVGDEPRAQRLDVLRLERLETDPRERLAGRQLADLDEREPNPSAPSSTSAPLSERREGRIPKPK